MNNDMTSILRNFANAESGTGTVVDAKTGEQKVSTAAAEKNAMKALLEGLDSAQKSVNQMPAQHKMGSGYGKKHPAEKFLVGGEHDEEPSMKVVQGPEGPKWVPVGKDVSDKDGETKSAAGKDVWGNKKRSIWDDVTEEAVTEALRAVKVNFDDGSSMSTNMAANLTDKQIHDYYSPGKRFNVGSYGDERMAAVKNIEILEARVEEDTIAKRKPGNDVHKKQSFADVFRSMDETEEDMAGRFKKELHGEKSKKALHKGDNGKFDLSEEEDSGWGDEMIEDIKMLLQDAAEDRRVDLAEELRKIIAIYEK